MPEDESYREVRYELENGKYLLSIYDGSRVQRLSITRAAALHHGDLDNDNHDSTASERNL